MRRQRLRKPSDAWGRWSASKLNAAMACPLRCFYEYALELPAPTNPAAAFGTAMHYLFYRFFQRHPRTKNFPYQTKEDFRGAWWSYWWSAVECSGASEAALTIWRTWNDRQRAKARDEGRYFRTPRPHGFGAWSEPVESVRWRNDDEPEKYFRYGQKAIGLFFDRHDDVRRDGRRRWVEKRFSFSWGEALFAGYIDRLDLEEDGAVIYDYKLGEYQEHLVLAGLQMTAYQHAYEMVIRPNLASPRDVPLKAIRIYDYMSGTYREIPARDATDIGALTYYLAEAQAYFRGVLTGKQPDPGVFTSFVKFRWNDMREGTTTPRLPVGDHCMYCSYARPCTEYVRGQRPLARVAFREKCDADVAHWLPEVIRLPIFESPIVRDSAAAVTALPRLYSSLWPQLTLGIECPPAPPLSTTARRPPTRKRHAEAVRRLAPSQDPVTV